ncbi:MAG: prepilin-type N-terminal cleavage/methylation domain-containing protein [Desulfobacterales bacterium]|nr:MAG: prepilin-type N-terminal cleavage/methylation domain-containing protein [Desulfobacterales bacterium]
MIPKPVNLNQRGFSLVELLAVMVIMSVLASVTVHGVDVLSSSAEHQALDSAIRELNSREYLAWTNIKLSFAGWNNDGEVFSAVDKDLGSKYDWNPGPNVENGTLHFGSQSITLTRTPSTKIAAGLWKKS